MTKFTRFRCAVTGRFVTAQYALLHPRETVKLTIKKLKREEDKCCPNSKCKNFKG
jgi:hypothetical protein